MKGSWFIGAWCLVLAPVPTFAQAPLPLTLEQAVARGVESSPRLMEARAREAAAEAGRQVRRAMTGPAASVTAGYLRTNHVDEFAVPQPGGGTRVIFPDIPNNWRLRTELTYPLWTGGRTGALLDAAEADSIAAKADAEAVAADVTLEISVAYWSVVTARAAVAVLDEALARTDAWVSDVRARVDAGTGSPHEIPQATAVRARQRVQRIQAANAATVADRELARVVGLPADVTVDPISSVSTNASDLPATVTDVLVMARRSRAERAAAEARSASFQAAARAALSSRLPQVTSFAGIEPARPNQRFVPRVDRWHTSWDLGVSVTWSIWDGGRARAEQAIARAQADATRARLLDFDRRLEVEVAQRLLDIESATEAVKASEEAVAAAAEVHRVLQVRFDAGVATTTEVLDAQVAWLEASLERTRLHAAARIAQARLARVIGRRLP